MLGVTKGCLTQTRQRILCVQVPEGFRSDLSRELLDVTDSDFNIKSAERGYKS